MDQLLSRALFVFLLFALTPVRSDKPPALALLGDSFFPESCMALPDGKSLLIGGFGDGSIQLVNIETQEARG